jgi:hypothetical protein
MGFTCPNKRTGCLKLIRAYKAYKNSFTFTILMTNNSNGKIVKGICVFWIWCFLIYEITRSFQKKKKKKKKKLKIFKG